ncbi:MAG: hypothetical protein LBF51_06780 [Zoogloeaceae bacterium]|nr:hypothetical protein [Zoogloeaceae bacterium]
MCAASRQQGAALVIGLIMLILITIVSLSVMQGVREQESMSGNAGRLARAFEKAEAGLRGVENEYLYAKIPIEQEPGVCKVNEDVEAGAGNYYLWTACNVSGGGPRDFTKLSGWKDGGGNAAHKVYRVALYGGAASPWYVVEQLPNAKSSSTLSVNNQYAKFDMEVLRVTALGADTDDPATASAVAVLQSVVVRQ